MASTLTPSLVGARLGARRAPFNRADARPVAPSAPRPRGAAPGRSRAVSAPHVPSRRSRARSLAVVTRAVSEGDGKKPEYSNATKMRSEAQAPFRVARRSLARRIELALRDVAALRPDGCFDVRGLGREQLLVVVLPDGVALPLFQCFQLFQALASLLEPDFGSEPVWNSNFGRPT